MATVTDTINNEQDKFEPQVVYIVSVDDESAIAGMERDSLDINLNESSDDFEPHSSRNIQTSATTTDPQFSFTLSRSDNSEALDLLGVRDDADDGKYTRGEAREKERIEIWYYAGDADPTVDEPDLIDAGEDVRIDVEGVETDTVVSTYDVEMDINGDVYWDTTSALAAE